MNEAVAPFDKLEVRQALSLALDREAIAEAIVYAEAATALVPHTVRYRADKNAEFRKKAEDLLATSAKLDEAKALLKSAGITAADYSFTLTVNAESEEHIAMAKLVVSAWKSLGFNVTLKALTCDPVYEIVLDENGEPAIDITGNVKQEFTGIYHSNYRDALQSGSFDVIALDLVATAPTAMAYLAPFATEYSGNGYITATDVTTGITTYTAAPHITGYDSAAYNAKIDEAQKAETEKERAALLVEAEKILMNEMPVIPVVYNKNVSLSGKKLSKVSTSFYTTGVMTKAKLSGYWKIAIAEGWVEGKKK